MARQSAAVSSLAMVPGAVLAPPDDTPPDEADIWRQIVAALPSSWMTAETAPLLTVLCRHVCYARWAAARLRAMLALPEEAQDLDVVARLMRMHGSESDRIAALSDKLRLSVRSKYAAERAARETGRRDSASSTRPWDDWQGNGRQ